MNYRNSIKMIILELEKLSIDTQGFIEDLSKFNISENSFANFFQNEKTTIISNDFFVCHFLPSYNFVGSNIYKEVSKPYEDPLYFEIQGNFEGTNGIHATSANSTEFNTDPTNEFWTKNLESDEFEILGAFKCFVPAEEYIETKRKSFQSIKDTILEKLESEDIADLDKQYNKNIENANKVKEELESLRDLKYDLPQEAFVNYNGTLNYLDEIKDFSETQEEIETSYALYRENYLKSLNAIGTGDTLPDMSSYRDDLIKKLENKLEYFEWKGAKYNGSEIVQATLKVIDELVDSSIDISGYSPRIYLSQQTSVDSYAYMRKSTKLGVLGASASPGANSTDPSELWSDNRFINYQILARFLRLSESIGQLPEDKNWFYYLDDYIMGINSDSWTISNFRNIADVFTNRLGCQSESHKKAFQLEEESRYYFVGSLSSIQQNLSSGFMINSAPLYLYYFTKEDSSIKKSTDSYWSTSQDIQSPSALKSGMAENAQLSYSELYSSNTASENLVLIKNGLNETEKNSESTFTYYWQTQDVNSSEKIGIFATDPSQFSDNKRSCFEWFEGKKFNLPFLLFNIFSIYKKIFHEVLKKLWDIVYADINPEYTYDEFKSFCLGNNEIKNLIRSTIKKLPISRLSEGERLYIHLDGSICLNSIDRVNIKTVYSSSMSSAVWADSYIEFKKLISKWDTVKVTSLQKISINSDILPKELLQTYPHINKNSPLYNPSQYVPAFNIEVNDPFEFSTARIPISGFWSRFWKNDLNKFLNILQNKFDIVESIENLKFLDSKVSNAKASDLVKSLVKENILDLPKIINNLDQWQNNFSILMERNEKDQNTFLSKKWANSSFNLKYIDRIKSNNFDKNGKMIVVIGIPNKFNVNLELLSDERNPSIPNWYINRDDDADILEYLQFVYGVDFSLEAWPDNEVLLKKKFNSSIIENKNKNWPWSKSDFSKNRQNSIVDSKYFCSSFLFSDQMLIDIVSHKKFGTIAFLEVNGYENPYEFRAKIKYTSNNSVNQGTNLNKLYLSDNPMNSFLWGISPIQKEYTTIQENIDSNNSPQNTSGSTIGNIGNRDGGEIIDTGDSTVYIPSNFENDVLEEFKNIQGKLNWQNFSSDSSADGLNPQNPNSQQSKLTL